MRNKKLKLRQKILRKYFSKQRMKSISCIEYSSNGSLICISNQFKVKEVIMSENSKQFWLACISLLLKVSTLQHASLKGEKAAYEDLLHKGIIILEAQEQIASFLKLLYNLELSPIPLEITINQQNELQRQCKEKTASSKSDLYYSHYYA